MKPMDNPLSPHAAANAGGFVPRIEKSGKPIQDGKEELGKAKIVSPQIAVGSGNPAQQKPTNTKDKLKKMGIDPAIVKKSVQELFDMGWYNWGGVPKVFEELFKGYGNFISASVKPSTMSGVPQKHRGIINTQAKPSYVMLELVILSQEGKRAALRNLESSPALQDEYTSAKGVTSVDMLEAVENNGNGYDFTLENTNSPKTDYAVYSYVDDMRTKRMIPRWAIS
tara:strand:- start:515 stop:1189 length:675 start_codon:yes stop_codon:yes gene_type:complete